MLSEKIIAGIVLASIGLLFFFNNKNISKGASKFYQALSKEENLKIIFKILGVFLVLEGIILILTK